MTNYIVELDIHDSSQEPKTVWNMISSWFQSCNNRRALSFQNEFPRERKQAWSS